MQLHTGTFPSICPLERRCKSMSSYTKKPSNSLMSRQRSYTFLPHHLQFRRQAAFGLHNPVDIHSHCSYLPLLAIPHEHFPWSPKVEEVETAEGSKADEALTFQSLHSIQGQHLYLRRNILKVCACGRVEEGQRDDRVPTMFSWQIVVIAISKWIILSNSNPPIIAALFKPSTFDTSVFKGSLIGFQKIYKYN
jgi:hypothetical protein